MISTTLSVAQTATGNDVITLIVVASIGFAGTIGASILTAYLTARASRRQAAQAAASQVAVLAAQEAVARAQEAAAEGARQLVLAAQTTEAHLAQIAKTTDATHKIINGEHSVLLRRLATLLRQSSDADPLNVVLRAEADTAEIDAIRAEKSAAENL